jgi:hypothetical protein
MLALSLEHLQGIAILITNIKANIDQEQKNVLTTTGHPRSYESLSSLSCPSPPSIQSTS